MGGVDLSAWIEECSTTGSLWYAKRLTGNDTLANGTHQAGPYIPKEVLFRALPALDRKDTLNPDIRFSLIIDSHAERRTVRAIWYNNRFHAGTRNETRLTGFGGASSALLDPESTGALVIFAFIPDGPIALCRIWVCRSEAEETLVEDHIGPVDPGAGRPLLPHPSDGFQPLISAPEIPGDCYLQPHALPPEWLEHFPSGLDIVRKTVELRPGRQRIPDLRLLRRRECEYQLFRSIEDAVELPIIKQGFTNVEEFARHANSLLQRRKSRSGRSLELHARIIFLEEGLREGSDFSYQPETEPGKRPDFVFPSADAYRDASFPDEQLRMLAVKTTCKDRWRQILNEADRIERKHLLTLQEGVSEQQFREMAVAGVQLVVPSPLLRRFPQNLRSQIRTLRSFIDDVRLPPLVAQTHGQPHDP